MPSVLRSQWTATQTCQFRYSPCSVRTATITNLTWPRCLKLAQAGSDGQNWYDAAVNLCETIVESYNQRPDGGPLAFKVWDDCERAWTFYHKACNVWLEGSAERQWAVVEIGESGFYLVLLPVDTLVHISPNGMITASDGRWVGAQCVLSEVYAEDFVKRNPTVKVIVWSDMAKIALEYRG